MAPPADRELGSLDREPDVSPLPPAALRAAGDAILARLLVPGGAVLAGFYAALAPVHYLLAPASCAHTLSIAAAGSSLFLGILVWRCWRTPPAPRWAHPLAVVAALVALVNIALYILSFPTPQSVVQLATLMICAGLVLHSRLWLGVELALCAVLWVVMVGLHPPHGEWVEASYLLFATGAVSTLVHEGRLRALARNETLRRLAIRHRDEARAALARAEREFRERSRIAREQRELDARVAEAQRRESLGVLAGGVAHDFNNLLTAVRGNAEWIEEHEDGGGAVSERARDIVVATRSASDLTRQMLAYAGRAIAAPQVVDLAALEQDLRSLARGVVPGHVEFQFRCPPGMAVRGDPTQVQQILLNLVTNAGEALAATGSRIRVEIRAVHLDAEALARCTYSEGAASGAFVELTVRDDGPGIDASIRDRVLDPFVSTKFDGRGLGLAAVQGLVRLHRGALAIESPRGGGTVVRVFLPRAEGPSEAATPTPANPMPQGRGAQVWVIDDEESVARVCAHRLETMGYSVSVFTEPRDALAAPGLDAIVLAFVDLAMDSLPGDECVLRLRERRPALPVVLVSGFHRPDVIERLERAGGVVVLAKPYDRADLAAACAAALDAQSASGARSAIDSSISITGMSSSIG